MILGYCSDDPPSEGSSAVLGCITVYIRTKITSEQADGKVR